MSQIEQKQILELEKIKNFFYSIFLSIIYVKLNLYILKMG